MRVAALLARPPARGALFLTGKRGRTDVARSVGVAGVGADGAGDDADGSVAKNERKSSCSSSPPPALLVSLLASN